MNRYSLILAAALLLLFICACDRDKLEQVYANDFESGTLGPEWKNEGGDWKIENGRLVSKVALNKDLALTTQLPAEGVIELEMLSHSPIIDVKFRAWGDIGDDMHNGSYHFILGGWGGKISTLARLDEHAEDRIEERNTRHKQDHWYKIKVVRRGGTIDWYLDGAKYLSLKDDKPLAYPQYAYFSFANWKTPCEFDNLKIYKFGK